MSEVAKKSRKRILDTPKDMEDGELPDGSSGDIIPTFTDGYDEKLQGDAEDRARLDNLNELQREIELFERGVKRDEKRSEWSIKCQLAQAKGLDLATKERCRVRRLNLEALKAANKRGGAIERLVAQRNIKKNKQVSEESSVSEELESSDRLSLAESVQSTPQAKKVKLKAADVYSDDSSSGSEWDREPEPSKYSGDDDIGVVTSRAELSKALLTRIQLEGILEKPVFERTVTNCFVRVSIGPSGGINSEPIYRICEIVGLADARKEYQLGRKLTDQSLRLEHGGEERTFQMDLVSNNPVTAREFTEWVATCHRDGKPLPTLSRLEQKHKDIVAAQNYTFTEGDVERIVQNKRRAGKHPMSGAYRKVCLIMERDMALASEDMNKYYQLENQITAIDEKSRQDQLKRGVPFVTASQGVAVSSIVHSRARAKLSSESTLKLSANEQALRPHMKRKYMKKPPFNPQLDYSQLLEKENIEANNATNVPQNERRNVTSAEKKNLYDLHNFEVDVNVDNLPKVASVFKDGKLVVGH
ncbi:RNA polymerase-associated protein Rtf1-like [Scaptodrosophila lebanonensis]|uniref:RNA polymerase-associated protein Rtf1-like n=1 Tax=Drosophila lebanonensis TaxID=7225 RepID=A0A6J2TPS6_DROLE|nr:RNA polymerase-associated protein Rtf1-like [Scaptodrosophila lebanonensis]